MLTTSILQILWSLTIIISKCSSRILPSFQFQLSEGTWLPKLLHTIESITITSHTNLFSFVRTFIFRIASFDPCWRSGEENHTQCNSLKLHRWQKLDQILQLKSSVDLMPATAKIHSKVTTTTSCKKHWSSPGAKSLNCRECLRQEGPSVHIHCTHNCRLKGYHSKCKTRHRWTNLKYIETDCNFLLWFLETC